jgi:hypothetical protein
MTSSPGEPDARESKLRRIIADATGGKLKSVATLDAARGLDDAVVVMEGDDGGQLYLVCPARLACCSESVLLDLLKDLDALGWNDPRSTHLCYELREIGKGIAGGMGGGCVTGDLWLHPRLADAELESEVRAVLAASKNRIDPSRLTARRRLGKKDSP